MKYRITVEIETFEGPLPEDKLTDDQFAQLQLCIQAQTESISDGEIASVSCSVDIKGEKIG